MTVSSVESRPHSTGPVGGARALPDDEDALRQLPGPLPEWVAIVVAVERAMLWARGRQSVPPGAAGFLPTPDFGPEPLGVRGLPVRSGNAKVREGLRKHVASFGIWGWGRGWRLKPRATGI